MRWTVIVAFLILIQAHGHDHAEDITVVEDFEIEDERHIPDLVFDYVDPEPMKDPPTEIWDDVEIEELDTDDLNIKQMSAKWHQSEKTQEHTISFGIDRPKPKPGLVAKKLKPFFSLEGLTQRVAEAFKDD